ncbi:MAG: TlpA family protein disulfide reductase [Gemmatimonadetes bacterium]|nr:TlpA family protein disulfide reductase [Gemmatimonadota bacterium]
MTRRQQWLVVGGIILAASGAAAVAANRLAVPDPVSVGFRAPDFQAKRLDDTTRVARLADYDGSVVLLNVWATWCQPCREEMPSIERLFQELGPRGLRVVAVSVDDGGAEADIREFVREFGLTFDVVHDPTGRILQTYQMIGVPETFLIDRSGVIRKKAFAADWYSDENRNLVAGLIGSGEERAF